MEPSEPKTSVQYAYENGFNSSIEEALKIINKAMIEKYGTHISTYEILFDIKVELLKKSFGYKE
jgi:hypothetical protein